jgi:hypothetical protein
MKRFKVLFGHRRMMVLLTLAILVLAATALIASSASFTASSTNGGNVFTAGNLALTATPRLGTDGGVILTASNMKPGYDQTGYVAIQTTGVGGLVTLAASQTTSSTPNLAAKLHITIQEVADINGTALTPTAPAPLMNNILMTTMPASTSLGAAWPAGTATHYYAFRVQWPSDDSTDNNYRGANTTATFAWNAVSN